MLRIVLSGINIDSAGMLSIYKDCISELLRRNKKLELIALVHRRELFQEFYGNVTLIEFPKSKKSWLLRCYYEYVYFKKISRRLKPDIWISMHDMTPNVNAKKKVVYCHNPSPFFKLKKGEGLLDWKMTLFIFFYKYVYKFNITKNDYVIVQQEWLRAAFRRLYKINNIIVARPNMVSGRIDSSVEEKFSFIYPTMPRMYKNIEIIGEALRRINSEKIKVYITISGTENKYAKLMLKKYAAVPGMRFIGMQKREKVMEYYNKVDGLIFPSRLESWGLPLSEFSVSGKKIIAADLPYARENLNGYNNVKFFTPDDAKGLAVILEQYLEYNEFTPDSNIININNEYVAQNWQELFDYILGDKEG